MKKPMKPLFMLTLTPSLGSVHCESWGSGDEGTLQITISDTIMVCTDDVEAGAKKLMSLLESAKATAQSQLLSIIEKTCGSPARDDLFEVAAQGAVREVFREAFKK